jgi:hypothetical protein
MSRTDPGEPYIHPGSGNPSDDEWSDTNDPLEYIKTTADGARAFNNVPDRDARILWHNLPSRMRPGEVVDYQVVVRNDGDLNWTEAEQFRFGQQEFLPREVVFGPGRFLLDDSQHEIPTFGGIFRGRPVTFNLHLTAPETPGVYETHWAMVQEHITWFGQVLTLPIVVAIEGDYNTDGVVDAADYAVWRDTRGQSGIGLAADGNSNGQIDNADYNLWASHFGESAGAAPTAIPEPVSLLLKTIAVSCFALGRRRNWPGLHFARA